MATSKRPRPDENTHITFIDQSTPAPKCPQLKVWPITLAEIKNLQQAQAQKDQAAAEANERTESKFRIERVLGCITEAGYETLYDFVNELLNVRDQQYSSRISKMLSQHGETVLNNICARQPDMAEQWAVGISGEILAQEGQRLAKFLQPCDDQTTSELLLRFSLERIMAEAEDIAPALCQLLRRIAIKEQPDEKEKLWKNRSLVSSPCAIQSVGSAI